MEFTDETKFVYLTCNDLDITQKEDFAIFDAPLQNVVAEHVFEHLRLRDALAAARNIFAHLAEGGSVRVAVPDSLASALNNSTVAAISRRNDIRDGHLVRFTERSLASIFRAAGFHDCRPLEYFSADGLHLRRPFNISEGDIQRSSRYDPRGQISIILDCIKL